jgi:hypothetical protein
MEKRQLKVDLLGTSFVIQSTESPEHLARLTSYLRARIEEVKSRYSFADPLTVALLAALNVADELFRERDGRGLPGPDADLASVAQKLIDSIDESLLAHTPYGLTEKEGGAEAR